ncbi:MAG: hypothetical protein ACM31C_30530 [Acidobacteriota bacterium]
MSDDELHEYDLSAWEAPPPPPGLADGVLARLRAAVPVAAVETEPRASRRWWIAGVAVGGLAVAAAVLVIVIGGSRRAAAGHGEVVAARAQRLELDTASADLDAGAELAWRRERGALTVEQHRGTAAWRVANDTLRIDAGAGVASVEATGASLRVEVHMQLSDARVVGASAVTAAAVAFVTVVVYEGHVKVTASGQTVNVEPGATVEVHPGQPPGPPALVGTDDEVHRLQQQVEDLQREVDQQRAPEQHVAGGPPAPALDTVADQRAMFGKLQAPITACAQRLHASGTFNLKFVVRADGTLDAKTFQITLDHAVVNDADALLACMKDATARTAFPKHAATYSLGFPVAATIADTLDRAMITDAMHGVHAEVMRCGEQHPAKGIVKVHLRVAPEGNVTNTDIEATPDPSLGACVAALMLGIHFPATKTGGAFSYPFVFDGKPGCDADALDEKARQAESVGQHATALASFEAAIACKPSDRRYQLAFMAACNAANVAKAKFYYPKVLANRHELAQMCVRNGIPEAELQKALVQGTFLELQTTPSAKVLLDGNDTKLVTPVTAGQLRVSPGKHKVTFVIGDDRYTYPVVVEAGQTAMMSKDLH